MKRVDSILLFLFLIWVGSLQSQTNNFWYNYYGNGISFDSNGKVIFHIGLEPNSPFDLSTPYGIANWQGKPMFYARSNGIYLYKNSFIDEIEKLKDGKLYLRVFGNYILSADTSNYLIIYHNFRRNHPVYNDTAKGGDFIYSYIARDKNAPSGFKIPEEKKDVVLPVNQLLIGMTATRDSMAQPVIVTRTRDYLYSYKTLPGGQVVKLDSIHAPYYAYTPDSILKHPDFRAEWQYAWQPQLNHKGDKVVFAGGYIGYPRFMSKIIQNVRYIHIADFDKHTGKFSNARPLYLHYWDPLSVPNPEPNYLTVFQYRFSPNDRFLYFNALDFEYTKHLNDDNNKETFSKIKGDGIFQLDLNNPMAKPVKVYYTLSANAVTQFNLNHLGEFFFCNQFTKELHKIKQPNNSFPECELELNSQPVSDSEQRIIQLTFSSHVFDFLRIEQEIDYTCSGQVKLHNKSLKDIGFNYFKWHIVNEDGELDVYEQFEPPVLDFKKDGNYPVKLFARSPKGGGYGEWYIDTIRVRIPEKPVADFFNEDTVVCRYLPLQFVNQSISQDVHPEKGKSFLWDFGDGNTSTEENPVHTYTQAGNHTVSLYFSNGYCDSFLVKTQYIRVIDAPKPGFEISSLQGCSPFTVHITDTATHEVDRKTYYFSDTGVWLDINQTQFSHTFKQPGIYRIIQKLYGISGCEIMTDSVEVVVSKGITKQDTFDMLIADIRDKVIDLNWKGHPHVTNYLVFRGTSLNNLQLHAQTKDTFWTDNQNTPAEYFYIVLGADSCGNTGTVGNYAKPVWLKAKMIGNNEAAELNYSNYEMWPGENKYYFIQKFIQGDWMPLSQNEHNETYTDEDFTIPDSLQSCYRIQTRDLFNSEFVSHSNVVCLDYLPYLYIPNAFSPNNDGINDRYSLSAIGIKEYRLQIYNRWGQKLFDELNQSWDGKSKGVLVPEGIYMSYVQYMTKDGKSFEYKTAITVIW
jgi:gliding motility-associated-like protein